MLASLPPELRLIGGLAVMCRVGMPHRTTVDLDAVTRGLVDQDAVLARLAVTATGGGQYTFAHALELDVIDVAPHDADELVDEWAARRRAHRPRDERGRAHLGARRGDAGRPGGGE